MPGLLPPFAAFRACAPTRLGASLSRSTPLPPRPAFRTLTTSARAFQRPTLRQAVPPRSSTLAAPGFFARSYLPAPSRGSFFTASRYLSTSAAGVGAGAGAGAGAAPVAEAVDAVRTIPKSLPIWLLGCSALVFGIIVIGGLTRLTESGLSIVEWNPITGVRPPITDAEWDAEWDKYRLSPEGVM
jgi:hypothetical protein